MSGTITLLCWVIDTPTDQIFPIQVGSDEIWGAVKNAIKEGQKPEFDDIASKTLKLWKVTICRSQRSLLKSEDFLKSVMATNPLDPIDSLSTEFNIPLPDDSLNIIIIQRPACELLEMLIPHALSIRVSITPCSDLLLVPRQTRRNSSPPRAPGNFAQRRATVAALYARLRYYGFIQVRGTPGSGKTTLARLLAHHIKEERIKVIWINGWCEGTIGNAGGHRAYFKEQGWVEGDKTVFIFDEAQLTYWDGSLWRDFFKNLQNSKDTQAIVFTSYGSASTRFYVVGTPIDLNDMQRVTLKAIPHKDNLPSVGLCFTKDEMDELVSVFYTEGHYFHERFFRTLLLVTGGHPGLLCDIMRIIVADDSYRRLKSSGELYTWNTLLKMVEPRQLFTALSGASVFTRGLPRDPDLQNVAFADIFSRVLRDGYVVNPDDTSSSYHDNLMVCFRNGWLHSDKKDHSGDTVIYFFASLLHRWFVEWKLWDRYSTPPIITGDILTFVISIIKKFSSKRLATERTLPFGEIQSVPEAQYQVEFYRCCASGSIVTFPEYGTGQGRVDFYIPAKEWGVELLRNGDRLAEHSGRFSNKGSYATTLSLSDYIILDCRTTKPRDPHPGLKNLYHIVFSNDFNNVTILNNKLAHITQFKLLGSA